MKRILVAILLGMLLIMHQSPALMAKDKSENLTEVIIKTKEQIDISETLSDFDYREYGEDETLYNLNWSNPNSKEFATIKCDAVGNIIRYTYDEEVPYSNIATVSYEQAKKTADDFLSRVATSYKSQLRLQESGQNTRNNEYRLVYQIVQNDIPLYDSKVSVAIHKQTGKVTYFSGVVYDPNTQFETGKPKLTLEQAQKAYLSKIDLPLKYRLYEDDEDNTQSILVYELENVQQKGISALTGEIVEGYREDRRDKGVVSTMDTVAAGVEINTEDYKVELTETERVEVESRKEFLSPENVQKKAAAYFPILSKLQIEDTYIEKDHENYRRTMSFVSKDEEDKESALLQVDAKTGEVISYYYNQYLLLNSNLRFSGVGSKEEEKQLKKWSEKEANAFMRQIAPKVSQEVKLEVSESTEDERQYFNFERIAGGIPVEGNGVYLFYDPQMGEVIGYNKSWDKVSFKSPATKISKEEAIKKVDLELFYMKTGKDRYSLVYNHVERNKLIDAFSGKIVDYRGNEVIEESCELYSDIKGHPHEEIIKKLYYSGIYLKGDELKPNEAITLGELKELLEKVHEDRRYYVKNTETIEQTGKLEGKDLQETLTREEGICLLVSASYYGDLADVSKIFAYPYEDKDFSETYKGYVATAYGLGWLEAEGAFRPTEKLTKAEAMVYLYKALDDLV